MSLSHPDNCSCPGCIAFRQWWINNGERYPEFTEEQLRQQGRYGVSHVSAEAHHNMVAPQADDSDPADDELAAPETTYWVLQVEELGFGWITIGRYSTAELLMAEVQRQRSVRPNARFRRVMVVED